MKMGRRMGRVLPYTPDEAKRVLTEPLLQVLRGRAQPVFSNRDRGAWSPTVLIVGVTGTDGRTTTVSVGGRQWEDVVVPLLRDPLWASGNPVLNGDAGWLSEVFGNAVREAFTVAGYGPGAGA